MQEPISTNSGIPRWLKISLISLAVIFLCGIMTLGGFVAGRFTAGPPNPESLPVADSQQVEVTREVAVTVIVTVPSEPATIENQEPTSEPVQPVQPTAAPTATPIPLLPPMDSVDDLDLAIFYEAWELILEDFDGDVPVSEEVIYAAIRGSLEILGDDYTRFAKPEIAARMREDLSGSVSGIGAIVRENEDGGFEIVSLLEGQPAQLAGLLPGDIIIGVEGSSVIGTDFDEVLLMVRGPAGSEVRLEIARESESEPLAFSIVRARFEVPVVVYKMLGDETNPVAYVRLTEFNRNAESSLIDALNELLAQDPVGIVFDLRNNPGGFLDQAIKVADVFLPASVVAYERNRQGMDQAFQVESGDLGEDLPVVILVNGGSASASEIVAGAVQDLGRGALIGETTFGKGSVQTLHQLSDGSELRVTIAKWFTPNNRSISDEGISPDIEVVMPVTVLPGSDEDVQLERAIQFLITGE